MEKLRKCFVEYDMTWPRVLLLALGTAMWTAAMAAIPLLNDTSFEDISVTFEWWFLFAVFIVVNCKKWWEASLKCFVFFLVSQPLIYLFQVPFSSQGWGLFGYYRYWFILTLLTLPGAAVAYQLKRKSWLSIAVLCVATGYLTWQGATYFHSAALRFPRHLLSGVFCLALAVFFVFVLLDNKKQRIAALAIPLIIFAAAMLWNFLPGGGSTMMLSLDEGEWTYTVDDASIADITVEDGNTITITGKKNGSAIIDFENADGTVRSYCIVVNGKSLMVSPVD